MGNTAVLIAAFNEAKNLPGVLEPCRKLGYEIFVVDDGSNDDTAKVARAFGANVLRHRINLGQGSALITGFRAALAGKADVIVCIDADGQHDPEEVPLFLEQLEKSGDDIVVGSRVIGENHPNAALFRRVFLPYVTRLINVITGYKMTDAMCGFRAFRASSLKPIEPVLIRMLEVEYIASEMFIRFSKAGLTISEVPVKLRDRQSGKSYKGLVRYGVGIAMTILRALFDVTVRQK